MIEMQTYLVIHKLIPLELAEEMTVEEGKVIEKYADEIYRFVTKTTKRSSNTRHVKVVSPKLENEKNLLSCFERLKKRGKVLQSDLINQYIKDFSIKTSTAYRHLKNSSILHVSGKGVIYSPIESKLEEL
ncbi:hypothetical protein QKV95_gp054 [Poseidoniales virus YSH_150918]|uniref:Uncharacterized protein n=1 Tax=Poseidoniales virus YSH_150918 TaxID=3071324 RepID=A0A976YE24_9CAUD|nr:hypothetical protein QKV95_gp054 [Yangshan Harbor Poseidoniales virus]UVF62528.1 hypothetical protein [Poseidoniales virus YSH_150918]